MAVRKSAASAANAEEPDQTLATSSLRGVVNLTRKALLMRTIIAAETHMDTVHERPRQWRGGTQRLREQPDEGIGEVKVGRLRQRAVDRHAADRERSYDRCHDGRAGDHAAQRLALLQVDVGALVLLVILAIFSSLPTACRAALGRATPETQAVQACGSCGLPDTRQQAVRRRQPEGLPRIDGREGGSPAMVGFEKDEMTCLSGANPPRPPGNRRIDRVDPPLDGVLNGRRAQHRFGEIGNERKRARLDAHAPRPRHEVVIPEHDMLIAFDVEAVREEMQRERALSGAFRPDHDEALAFEHKTSAMHHRRSRSLRQDGGEDGLVDAIGRFNERGLDPLSVRELKPEAVIGLIVYELCDGKNTIEQIGRFIRNPTPFRLLRQRRSRPASRTS